MFCTLILGEKSFLSYSDSKQDQDVAALLATRKLVKVYRPYLHTRTSM